MVKEERKMDNKVQSHHQEYTTKMKQYADQRSHAKEHNFKVGDVDIASQEHGQLDAMYNNTRYVLIRNTSPHAFERVNTEDGSTFMRNVKHLRHVPMLEECQVPEQSQEPSEEPVTHTTEPEQTQNSMEVQRPPETVLVPQKQLTTRSERVIKRPECFKDMVT